MITVTKAQLASQVTAGWVLSGDHILWLDEGMQILTEDGPRPPAQTLWFLEMGDWVDDLHITCGVPNCIKLEHLTADKQEAQEIEDAKDLALVQRQSVTLADLYRKGRKQGLIQPGSGTYGG